MPECMYKNGVNYYSVYSSTIVLLLLVPVRYCTVLNTSTVSTLGGTGVTPAITAHALVSPLSYWYSCYYGLVGPVE